MNSIPSPGVQQPNGIFSSGRFASSIIPVALSQSTWAFGIPNRGGINGFSSDANGVAGSIPGVLSASPGLNNWNSVPMGMSQLLGNAAPRITSNAMGNMVGSLRKQASGVPIVQQNQEFRIQNEDFPALPGFKGAPEHFVVQYEHMEKRPSLLQH
ncbi:unnamed protein product [Brassica rapa]|uniref:Uncharacterized protein n=1 Tax=Brassica campestris TaxID=3711 RepID=A0A3P6D733_BRACM|nr:unnamed protein product [Brassica rapa]VDD18215.1 unnamed protein product [Brassica rapa]